MTHDCHFCLRGFFILAGLICYMTDASSQSAFSVRTGGVYTYNAKAPELENDKMSVSGGGFELGADFVFSSKKTRLMPGIGFGIKKLYTSGTVGKYEFSGETFKVFATANCDYAVTGHWRVGAVFLMENNKDYWDLRGMTSDQHRYNAGLKVGYEFGNRLLTSIRYTRCLYPTNNFYLIHNPADQLSIGLSYKFLRL